ncbi:hypothetical protein ACIGZJ_36610 [Kitasatospora sp. NPDC052868]|uniref:hypothetical protein n=1 Tax=Kitasatospora sp. NPDC052868 TaxID=3364060 RepID=UPI0037C8221A
MTTYQTTAVPGQLSPAAPLDPQAVRDLARHASDVLFPAGIGPDRTPLGEAAAQLSIALSGFGRLVSAEPVDQLECGEEVLSRLRRASGHVYEHMADQVPPAELKGRNVGLVDSNLREGLPVVGTLTAELLLAGDETATVALTMTDAHRSVAVLDDDTTVPVPVADHLVVRDGLHELARILAPLATGKGGQQ